MSIKDVKLRKGMVKDEVNNLIGEYGKLHDEIYLGNSYSHDWVCSCGDIIKSKRWSTVREYGLIKCDKCKYNETEQRYKYEVEKTGEYEYIRSYRKGDKLPNGRIVSDKVYIQVKHKYCGSIYTIRTDSFINRCDECSHCCGSYENSFAHYIEQELGEPLDKYWDFNKNTVNPYHIWKNSHIKVWIKCTEKDYHGSYETLCYIFKSECRCPYCNTFASKKVHPKDSFAQYHIDHTDKDFLTKYWSDKNIIDPWSISPNSSKKVWIKCQEHEYHNDFGGYEIICHIFAKGGRCGYCYPSGKTPKVHPFDSFGYKHFDKVMSWHPDNKISPFKVSPSSHKKYKFICPECNHEWNVRVYNVSNNETWCPQCSASKGEQKINNCLRLNNIDFIPQKEFSGLLGLGNGDLSYDFYIPEYNLLIEYQGEYHDGNTTNQTKKEFKTQQEHDRRKKEYAKDNNIKLLEIWYYDFDNIEEILKSELNI